MGVKNLKSSRLFLSIAPEGNFNPFILILLSLSNFNVLYLAKIMTKPKKINLPDLIHF